MGKLGAEYDAWVHRPVQGAPTFFGNPVLEAVTKTPWCAPQQGAGLPYSATDCS